MSCFKLMLIHCHNFGQLITLVFPGSLAGKESARMAGDPSLILGLGRSAGEGTGCPLLDSVFPGGPAGKESAGNAGVLGSIPGLGRSPGEGNSYPLQCSDLEKSTDLQSLGSQRVWHSRVTFTFTFLMPKSGIISLKCYFLLFLCFHYRSFW